MNTSPADHAAAGTPVQPSQWQNTRERYGRIARWLHWSVALLFLVLYVAVYYRHWFTVEGTSANWTALQIHLTAGITVAVFVGLRIYWRLTRPQPEEPEGSALEHAASRWMHRILYAFMVIMPITGYLGTGVTTEFFGLIDIPSLRDTAWFQSLGLSWEEWEAPIDFIHKQSGAWLVWVLVLLHAGAALWHHFFRGDDVLRRMLAPHKK